MATINPFQAPINYAVEVQSPFEAALGGFKLGASMQELEAARQKRALEMQNLQAEQARQQQYQTGLNAFFAKPPEQRTFNELQPLLVGANKQQFDALKLIGENMGAEKLASSKRFTSQVLLALEANPETATTMLQERIDAETDPNQKRAFQDILTIANQSPQQAARIVESLGAGTFGEDWYKGITSVRAERRTEAQQPDILRQKKADADKAVADAKKAEQEALNAALTAEDDVAKAQAQSRYEAAKAQREATEAEVARLTVGTRVSKAADEAKEAGIKAEFAERTAIADLKQKAASLGLTQAQTGSALAQTRKLGVEIASAALELEALKATGGIDPAKAFEQEEKIRREFQARTKVYSELGTTFSNLQASAQAKTGPGDIALITGFMKMLDPGSVVRETEFATARDTAGLFDRLSNQAQKLQSGQIFALDSKQRQEYVSLAKQYLDAAQKKAADDKKALGVVVKNYRLNPDNVFGPEPVSAGGGRGFVNPPAANSVTVGGQTYTRPANFTDAQWNAYKQSVGAQ